MFIHNVPSLPIAEQEELKAVSEAIVAEYKALFPESLAYACPNCFCTGYHVSTFLGNKSTFSSNISRNDQMYHAFSVDKVDKGIEVTLSVGGSINILPESIYLAMSRAKIPFRKKSGTAEKVIAGMVKHFGAMKASVFANEAKIYGVKDVQKIIDGLK